MIPVLLTLLACATTTSEVVENPDDEQARDDACRNGNLEACYRLRTSADRATREVALRTACEQAHRDSCALLYEWLKAGEEFGDTSVALGAAIDGCRQGDARLCKAALDFAQIDPGRTPVVEKHRAELEALLAEQTP